MPTTSVENISVYPTDSNVVLATAATGYRDSTTLACKLTPAPPHAGGGLPVNGSRYRLRFRDVGTTTYKHWNVECDSAPSAGGTFGFKVV